MMIPGKRILGWSAATVALFGAVALAQEIEPPFTWKGSGEATLLAREGINEITFDLELAVDADGGFKGKTSNDEGQAAIKHMFYGERVEHESMNYYSRKAILVLMINEYGDNPALAVLNGRLLAGRFFTGEVLLKRYEQGSASDKALGVGSSMATQIDENSLPWDLKSALQKCLPLGTVKVQGAYKE